MEVVMGWSGWAKDSTGGETNTKTEKDTNGNTDTHYLRTSDNSREGDRDNHSHVMVRENADGSKTAHGFHGIKK